MHTERIGDREKVPSEHLAPRWKGAALEKTGVRQVRSARRSERPARALGWFSLGLGMMQLLGPAGVARWIGVRPSTKTRTALRLVGLREMACGMGLLTKRRPAAFAWLRVAGDLMDFALLGAAMAAKRSDPVRLLSTAAAVAGVTVTDTAVALRLSNRVREEGGIRIAKAITINRSPEEVYRFWRDFQNLPRFMQHLESVQAHDGYSRWRARTAAGLVVEWDAELLMDTPNEYIGWRSIEGSKIRNQGSVRFRPAAGGKGTELFVELTFEPPGGAIGAALADLFGAHPAHQISEDLRRLKQVLEVGEVVHSDASIHRGPHPARPTERAAKLLGGRP